MAEPYLAEIHMFGFNFSPRGWSSCDGQILPINQNQSLYSLIGTIYGGDGRTSFALPDLRGRIPIHSGAGGGLTSRRLGEHSGIENVTLTQAQIPSHTHQMQSSSVEADELLAAGNVLAEVEGVPAYGSDTPTVPMHPNSLSNSGGNQSHSNMQPSQVINYCIALQGLFPSRN